MTPKSLSMPSDTLQVYWSLYHLNQDNGGRLRTPVACNKGHEATKPCSCQRASSGSFCIMKATLVDDESPIPCPHWASLPDESNSQWLPLTDEIPVISEIYSSFPATLSLSIDSWVRSRPADLLDLLCRIQHRMDVMKALLQLCQSVRLVE